jgi:hypothetical protein
MVQCDAADHDGQAKEHDGQGKRGKKASYFIECPFFHVSFCLWLHRNVSKEVLNGRNHGFERVALIMYIERMLKDFLFVKSQCRVNCHCQNVLSGALLACAVMSQLLSSSHKTNAKNKILGDLFVSFVIERNCPAVAITTGTTASTLP